MALKGYIDFSAHRNQAREQLIRKMGRPDYEPPFGWDAYLGTDADLHRDQVCGQCGSLVPEVRPFGPDYLGICEECAKKDLAGYEKRRREVDGA